MKVETRPRTVPGTLAALFRLIGMARNHGRLLIGLLSFFSLSSCVLSRPSVSSVARVTGHVLKGTCGGAVRSADQICSYAASQSVIRFQPASGGPPLTANSNKEGSYSVTLPEALTLLRWMACLPECGTEWKIYLDLSRSRLVPVRSLMRTSRSPLPLLSTA